MIKLAIYLCCFYSWHCLAEIYEIKTMDEIFDSIDDQTLVVFDIDNTLIEPVEDVGSDQHYYYMVSQLEKRYRMSSIAAHKKAEGLWNAMQYHIKTKPVETRTPELIAHCQQRGIPFMALTARTAEIRDITHQQLLENGIDFSRSAPLQMDIEINSNGNISHYTNGILFQGEGHDKGEVLTEFLRKINCRKNIIFVDDKSNNVNNVNRALQKLGIRHREYRYGATDARVQTFNAQCQDRFYLHQGELCRLINTTLKD